MRTLNRRSFGCRILAAACTTLLPPLGYAASSSKAYRAAVIGHTGAGDYGHGYDRIFSDLPAVTVVAVADPDAAGRRRAVERSGARREYTDYHEMLAREQPDLVCVAPRVPTHHRDMLLASIKVARGIFVEKPFTATLREADEVLEASEQRKVKILVAHNRRYTPEFVRARALIAQGFAGEIRGVRIEGKQDRRAGGEDLVVLGTHDFDLLRWFFGNPQWCLARVAVGGRDARQSDVRWGNEPIRIAGDTIHATLGFERNVVATWSSVTTADDWNTRPLPVERWAFEILGTRRIVAYQSGIGFRYLDSPFLLSLEQNSWRELPEPDPLDWPEPSRHPIRSLIYAAETNTEPLCSGADGRWTVEIITAIHESHRTRRRAEFPLRDRSDPLDRYS